jgi:anti-anti-sigma factor
MALKLSVIARHPTGISEVAAYGEATAADFPNPESFYFDKLLGPAWNSQRVALDMDAVSYLDSAAISWLINLQRNFRQGGGGLALHHVQPHVKNILNLLKVERVIPLCADVESAVASLRQTPQRTPA